MKLKSMVTFVLETIEDKTGRMQLGGVANALHTISEYAQFLSQPLTLGMFVPCDLNDNILNKPKDYDYFAFYAVDILEYTPSENQYKLWREYQQAKERVLFEGFELKGGEIEICIVSEKGIRIWFPCKKTITIEYLIDQELTLTESAITKIKGV